MESSSFTDYIILQGAVRKTCYGIGFRIKKKWFTLSPSFSLWNLYETSTLAMAIVLGGKKKQ